MFCACAALASGDPATHPLAHSGLGTRLDGTPAGQLAGMLGLVDLLVKNLHEIPFADGLADDAPMKKALEDDAAELARLLARAHLSPEVVGVLVAPLTDLARSTASARDVFRNKSTGDVTLVEPRRKGLGIVLDALATSSPPPHFTTACVALQSARDMSFDATLDRWAERMACAESDSWAFERDPVLAAAALLQGFQIRAALIRRARRATPAGHEAPIEDVRPLLAELDRARELLAAPVQAGEPWARVLELDRLGALARLEVFSAKALWSVSGRRSEGAKLLHVLELASAWGYDNYARGIAREGFMAALEAGDPVDPGELKLIQPDDFLLAELARDNGDPDQALSLLQRAVPGDGNQYDGNVHAIRALALLDKGLAKEARAEVDKIDAKIFSPMLRRLHKAEVIAEIERRGQR